MTTTTEAVSARDDPPFSEAPVSEAPVSEAPVSEAPFPDPPGPAALAAAHSLNTELYQLMRTLHTLKTNLHRDGVPQSTYLLLFRLISDGPRRAGALAEAVGTDPSTVSRQIDWLVRSGLVERQADPSDGRATLLVATAAGVETQQEMRAARDRLMAEVVAAWPTDDVEQLTRLLARFTATLTDQMPQLVSGSRRGGTPDAPSSTPKDLP